MQLKLRDTCIGNALNKKIASTFHIFYALSIHFRPMVERVKIANSEIIIILEFSEPK